MNKHSKDYIPTDGEFMAERDAVKDWKETHEDPRQKFIATYFVNGMKLSENVLAENEAEAQARIKQQCGMVGWIPMELKIERT